MTPSITESSRGTDSYGRSLRIVKIMFPGLGFEFNMTSFNGGTIELYKRDVDLGESIERYMGTIRDYFPGGCTEIFNGRRNKFIDDLASAWFKCQPSKAARRAFKQSITFKTGDY